MSEKIFNIDPEIKRALEAAGWPAQYDLDVGLCVQTAEKNGHQLFDLWFDFVRDFQGIIAPVKKDKFEFDPLHDISIGKEPTDFIIDEIIKKTNIHTFCDEEFNYILAEDGTIYATWSGMIFYAGKDLNEALHGRWRFGNDGLIGKYPAPY